MFDFYLPSSARLVAFVLSVFIVSVSLLVGFGPLRAEAQPLVPRFEPADCLFEVKPEYGDVTCGDLIVYENRDEPAEGTLRLAVAILKSTADAPAPDPLVYLVGGPGYTAIDHMPRYVVHPFWNQYRATRDLIFFDQRGAGNSEPTFCPSLNRTLYIDGFGGFSPDELRRRHLTDVQACREEMIAKGVDLSQYNSVVSARDLDDLRRSLGVDVWNLFGISYGTRLGLEALRQTPDGIRSVILDSAIPVNATIWSDQLSQFAGTLRRVFDQCAANQACHEAFPTLEEDTYDLFDRLEREPLVAVMEDTSRFPDRRLVADGTVVAWGVYQGLYSYHFVPYLPLVIRELKAGNVDLAAAMGETLVEAPDDLSRGMHYSVRCNEEAPFVSATSIAAETAAHPQLAPMRDSYDHLAVCDTWHPYRADSTTFQPVRSSIPALLMAGEFDPPLRHTLASPLKRSQTTRSLRFVAEGTLLCPPPHAREA